MNLSKMEFVSTGFENSTSSIIHEAIF